MRLAVSCLGLLLAATSLSCESRTSSSHNPATSELHAAIRAGDLPRVKQLLGPGAETEAPDESGATPLIAALLNGRTEIALYLLDRGANLDARATIEPQLLAHILPVDRTTRVAVTPLMIAAMTDSKTVVEALLDRGAAIGATGEDGLTPLHAAALTGRQDIVRLLLERGAPLDAVTESGETALDLALSANQVAIAEALELAGQADMSPPIDVAGHFAIAARTDMRPMEEWRWGAVPVGIAVGENGAVYWAQYRTGTVERASGPSQHETVATGLDGPLGVAFDGDRLQIFYTTDRHYPRAVARLLPGGKREPLVYGTRLNRPFAISVSPNTNTLYWTESINGRIRKSALDGSALTTIFDDGIASTGERPGVVPVSSVGIAVDDQAGFVFWSDLLGAAIVRARLDGSELERIVTAEDGVVFPTAVAVDPTAHRLYWADPGAEKIVRADFDGSHVEVFADSKDGVVEPYGLAVDAERRFLYWTDIAANAISRANVDRKRVEPFVRLDEAGSENPKQPSCDAAAARAQERFLRRWSKSIRTCVVKVAAAKAVKRRPSDVQRAAGTCTAVLHAAHDDSALRAALAPHCDRVQIQAHLEHTAELGAEIVAADLPRAPECLQDVRRFIAPADTEQARDAVAAIDDLLGRVRALTARPATPGEWSIAASGQTTTYASVTLLAAAAASAVVRPSTAAAGGPIAVAVPDDGNVRAGAVLAYVDNGDGTITDRNTGLTWEKKCDGCGPLHDYETAYRWRAEHGEMDVPGWLGALNSEDGAGFAGHDDWRLPRVEELLTIVDYEHFNPAVSPIFDGAGCGLGCGSPREPQCSCTRLGAYWTATEFAEGVVVVPFNLGLISRIEPTDAFARAVRGPVPPPGEHFVDNADGTITDRTTKLMWEKKCRCPTSLHDVDRRAAWSNDGTEETVWDWLAALNAENGRGFAGHDDWRVPNVKELLTLLEFSHSSPSIDPIFAQEGCGDLTSPECSCMAKGSHWSSTTFADFPAHALTIGFNTAILDDRVKTLRLAVRAVRGPAP